MTELQLNTKNQLIKLLKDCSSIQYQLDYKKAVPFVHIPDELIAQWESFFRIDKRWFLEIWTINELEFLKDFEKKFNKILKKLPDDIPDVPQVFEIQNWQKFMLINKELKEKLNIKS